MPKGQNIDYYSKTNHGLDYISATESEMNIFQEDSSENTLAQSSYITSCDSDYGLRRLFQQIIVNMVSTTYSDRTGSNTEDPSQAWAQRCTLGASIQTM